MKSGAPQAPQQRRFVYQSRTAAQWRQAACGDAPPPIGREGAGWLAGLLNRASRSVILSDWEACFVLDFDKRLAQYGARLFISEKQRAVLERIEQKLGKAQRS